MSLVQADVSDTLKKAEGLRRGEIIYLHPIAGDSPYLGEYICLDHDPRRKDPRVHIGFYGILNFAKLHLGERTRWMVSEGLNLNYNERANVRVYSRKNRSMIAPLEDFRLYAGREEILDGMRLHGNPNTSFVEDLLS